MWEPQHLTTLWASTACYRDSFILPYLHPLNLQIEYGFVLEQCLFITGLLSTVRYEVVLLAYE
jgi:hypothetical protein